MCRYFILLCLFFINCSAALAQPLNFGEAKIMITEMSLEEKVGQLFMAAFRQVEGKPLTAVTPEVSEQIQKYHLGGIILFQENFVDIAQTVKLNRQLQQAAGTIPLFIAVDQEGGRVNRFSFGADLPGNMALGASGQVGTAYNAGCILGEELKSLGINMDLAPVLDVNSNQNNPVIGLRSFGADAEMAGQMGANFIKGLHDKGIMAAIKHFPGHGDTSLDSHLGLPCVLYDKDRLNAVELRPFSKNLAAADLVMAAHIAFPALDNTKVLSQKDGQPVFVPASLSHGILTGLLREEWGYDGLIITDALEMKAITEHFGSEQAVVQAVLAGADILLMPSNLEKAYAGLIQAVKDGVISKQRLDQSVARILRLKLQLKPEIVPGAAQMAGSGQHRAEANKLACQAVTLLKNEQNSLPFRLHNNTELVVLAPWAELANNLQKAARRETSASGHSIKITAINYGERAALSEQEKTAINDADYIILGTYSLGLTGRTPERSKTASFAATLLAYLKAIDKKVAVMAMGTPYDIIYLPELPAYLAVYGTNNANLNAGLAAIFGSINPQGKLPVPIQSSGEVLFEIGAGLHY